MIILNRKRLSLITGIILLAIFAFTFQTANLSKTVQTVTLPVSNKVIVLDARSSESLMREHSLQLVLQRLKQI